VNKRTNLETRQRSGFLTRATERELMRLRQMNAIEATAGAWKDKDHPELKGGAAKYISNLRKLDKRRSKKLISRSR
jgi:hypothetical protein